ncbi:MAG: hypothetical protein ACLQJR_14705 [Stellaceae bacterium]
MICRAALARRLGLVCVAALLLAACDRQERAHEVHLSKGRYAGKPMTRLDAQQVTALERRAASENY